MTRARPWSLRRRLLIGLGSVLLVLGGGFFFVVADYAARAADRAYDRLLVAAALAIADTAHLDDGRVTVDLPYAAMAILAMARRDRVFYRITAPQGELVTGYPDLAPDLPGAGSAEPTYADARYRGAALRLVSLGRLLAGGEAGGWVTIVVAQTREEREALAREILVNAFAPIALTVLAGAGLIWLGVGRALAPLAELERLIRDRGPSELAPIETPAPVEVAQLVVALNRLMTRLDASLRATRAFLADAAHQIRTPLASLRAQAELAADEPDPSALRRQVEKIRRNAALTSQLTNQLLSDAMVTHRAASGAREPVDLAALVRAVAARAQAVAEEVPIRVDLTRVDGPVAVEGDPISLREGLANLVDNAVRYAGAGGPVEIRLSLDAVPGFVRVEVADRGPGIPAAERPHVLERFGRGSTAQGTIGSGLGLAIVAAVAAAHGGTLRLSDRPGGGLLARLDLARGATSP
jgi:two-component system sensor histidine kinase TctE